MVNENETGEAAERLLHIDHKVHEAVKGNHTRPVVKLIGVLSEIADQPQARLLCGSMMLAGLVRADARMVSTGVRMLLAHEIATAAKSLVKANVDRRRPRSASAKHEEKPRKGKRRDKEETSFPSGHSAGAMSVARAFSAGYPEYRTPALLSAGAVALAQIPRRAHYPTDVAAGLLVGLAGDYAAGLILRGARLTIRRFIQRV